MCSTFSAGTKLLDSADAFIFHSPFCKLVQKSVARLMLNDFLRSPGSNCSDGYKDLEAFRLVHKHVHLFKIVLIRHR